MIQKYRIGILISFGILALASLFFVTKLRFTFDFEQFFPDGDKDLTFFREFIKEFESDDNFLLVAVESKEGVFDTSYLRTLHEFTLSLKDITNITSVQSLTTMRYPIKTPFGLSTVPIIHIDDPNRFEEDKNRVLSDTRFIGNFINKKATALSVLVKTKNNLNVDESKILMNSVKKNLSDKGIANNAHMLGRAYFQNDLIDQQKKEVTQSSIISVILVGTILFIIFGRIRSVIIALGVISLGLLLFMGLMGAFDRPLSILAALYPVLMLIVGTSDVIHLMSKYIDELNSGKDRYAALSITMKEVGFATFLTSLTTAIGFATLLTSRLAPIRDFGLNSAVGVMVAYVATILVTPAILSFFNKESIAKLDIKGSNIWDKIVSSTYNFTYRRPMAILFTTTTILLVCFYGMTKITTNYKIEGNLPIGEQITKDYYYFEKEFSGFRPLEFAIIAKGGYKADDYEVVKEIDKLETYLQGTGVINSIISQATLYKSVSQMNSGNQASAYVFPQSEEEFYAAKRIIDQISKSETTILINKNKDKSRLSSKIVDIGGDSIQVLGKNIDAWVSTNLDSNIVEIKRTGTGLIIDKNSEYVRESLIKGLSLALLLISIVMALMLKSWQMLVLAFIPNIIPVIFGAALLGFLKIELEAGVSIVFAVIFGIAVDDTIHFLSRYKLCQLQGLNIEESIKTTFAETGKAIFFTTIVLFFGFMVMLFSSNPPTKTVGLLIAVTLLAALLADVLLLPVLMRLTLRDKK